jgi:UDP-N-acetylmuramyl tripeptide synthase
MELTDVRRLTGPNLFLEGPGAVGEAILSSPDSGMIVSLWRRNMKAILEAVGWSGERLVVRPYPGGASLVVSAPLDGLFVACDLIEWAWAAGEAAFAGAPDPDIASAAEKFRSKIVEDATPDLVALSKAAEERNVAFLWDDETLSLGLGKASKSWPREALPEPGAVDWGAIGDIPVAMVTGTNGKSTTVRLTAAIAAAAGKMPSLCSSDWVRIGRETIDEGDYSGPGGARLALREPRAEMAVLEVARGGLMRRGMALANADACAITNVAADHLGTYGITDVAALADAKFLLAKAVKPGGRLVLNVDDPELVRRSFRDGGAITWYGLSLEEKALAGWIAAGGEAAILSGDHFALAKQGEVSRILPVEDFPPGLGGAAKYNLSNALAAISLASALGLGPDAMAKGLAGFQSTAEENPGRGNFMELGGIRVLVDFAHNPHGVSALVQAVQGIPAQRRLFLLGQAGDRSDEDIRELTRVVWSCRPDRVIVQELLSKLRGRQPGEIPAVFESELSNLGAAPEAVGRADSAYDAVRQALAWARPGDFLVLLLYDERQRSLSFLERLQSEGWQAGDPLPT